MCSSDLGGGFTVGGGMTGVDSQMVAFQASPGEMVDIRRPGEPGGAGGRTAEVTMKGLSGKELFSGQMLADMVNALNDAYADGYKLKVA